VLAAIGLLLIALATLTPSGDPAGLHKLTPLWCLVCGGTGGADVIANLMLFLPFAIGLRLSGASWRGTVLLCAAISLSVELLQLVVIPGRDATLSDVLTNTSSGAIGAALAPQLPEAFRPSIVHARRLAILGAVVWLAAMGLSAWLLAPDVVDGPLRSGWAGKVWEPNIFPGQIRAVRLEGRPMPGDGTVAPDTAELRRRLDEGSFTLEAEVKSGGEVYWSSWIYKLKAGKREELTLYQLGRSAGIAVPVRGLEFGLQPVTATLPNGLPSAAGDSVRLHASVRRGTILLRSTYSGRIHSIAFGLSPAYGWRLVSPFELGRGDGVRWFTALCLVLSVSPLAYWAARGGRGAAWVTAAAIAAGLVVPGRLAGLPPAHWSEWAAAALGSLVGWALQRGAAYLERRCASPSASEFSSS
jgi:VanZ like protein